MRPAHPEILSVSQLNSRARLLLEDIFEYVCVQGELSNLAKPASGHIYFSLKDAQAQVRCALFKPLALAYRSLCDGQAVLAYGRLSLFEGRGDYQLIIERLEQAGEGRLRQAFEALKERLNQAGLFDQSRKKPLPAYPQRVGIISSPTGAVIRDIMSVFQRRAPHIRLSLIPTLVQGKEATAQIVQAIQQADRQSFDALILARGGGSLEDLWCFNEEAVAWAIAACTTPIISAIGHETDVSISDFVADVRAPTPSAAAELLAPHQQELQRQLSDLKLRLHQALRQQLQGQQQRLEYLSQRLNAPYSILNQNDHNLRLREQRLHQAMHQAIKERQRHLTGLGHTLHAISPLATLNRGYSILLDEQGQAIRRAAQVQPGQQLNARLVEGNLQLQVISRTNRSD